jgi:hypothetical protein
MERVHILELALASDPVIVPENYEVVSKAYASKTLRISVSAYAAER